MTSQRVDSTKGTLLVFREFEKILQKCFARLNFIVFYYLTEASFGYVDGTVTHLHVDPQAPHHGQAVLVVSQVLKEKMKSKSGSNKKQHITATRFKFV